VKSRVGRTGQGLQMNRKESSHRHHPDKIPTSEVQSHFKIILKFGDKVIHPIILNLFTSFPAYVMRKTLLSFRPEIIKNLYFYSTKEILAYKKLLM
jgi:hypothetical protein